MLRYRFLLAAAMLATALTPGVANADTAQGTCEVRNVTQKRHFGPNNGAALKKALREARTATSSSSSPVRAPVGSVLTSHSP
jgi:hypothetical protein